LGGSDKKDTHSCLLTRVGDSMLGCPVKVNWGF